MAQKPKPAPAKGKAPEPQRRPPPPPPRGQAQPQRPAPTPPQRPQTPPAREAAQRATGSAVAVASAASQVPEHLRARIAASSGKGVSKDAADNLVPLIYVLQELSPQTQSRDPKYIEGAVAGHFWLRGMDPPFIDGEHEGMVVQPCYFNKCVLEWQPNRGGFVGRHQEMPEDAEQRPHPQDPNRTIWMNKAGNTLVETREHVVRVHMPDGRRVPFVFPFSSTGHTVSRGWMFDMNQKQVDGNTVDSFCLLYRVKTKYSTNNKGSWFKPEVAFEGWVQDEADLDAGEQIYNAFASGEKSVDEGDYADETIDTSGGAEDGSESQQAGNTGGI